MIREMAMTLNEAIEILLKDPDGVIFEPKVWQLAIEIYNAAIFDGSPMGGK